MDLNTIWFILVSILFIGFLFLEGFDFGVGVLLPILGKEEKERRIIINTIGPFWDGNEVWLITAGGAIFAAFPNWYATMFSGFYLALLFILVALILRGVAFEFRSKMDSEKWRNNWDKATFYSSLLLAVLWGTALANLIKGVPIDKTMNFTGGFFDLINVYTLMAGILSLLIFVFHGAVFLNLKTEGEISERARKAAINIGTVAMCVSVIFAALTAFQTDLFKSALAMRAAIASIVMLCLSWLLVKNKKTKLSMLINGFAIALGAGSLFIGLFPRVIVSSISPEFSLTIYNAASSANTLSLMTKVAIALVPIVIAYQAWTYYIFRKRVTIKDLKY